MYSNAIEPAIKPQEIIKSENANKSYDYSGYTGKLTTSGTPDLRTSAGKEWAAANKGKRCHQ